MRKMQIISCFFLLEIGPKKSIIYGQQVRQVKYADSITIEINSFYLKRAKLFKREFYNAAVLSRRTYSEFLC